MKDVIERILRTAVRLLDRGRLCDRAPLAELDHGRVCRRFEVECSRAAVTGGAMVGLAVVGVPRSAW